MYLTTNSIKWYKKLALLIKMRNFSKRSKRRVFLFSIRYISNEFNFVQIETNACISSFVAFVEYKFRFFSHFHFFFHIFVFSFSLIMQRLFFIFLFFLWCVVRISITIVILSIDIVALISSILITFRWENFWTRSLIDQFNKWRFRHIFCALKFTFRFFFI